MSEEPTGFMVDLNQIAEMLASGKLEVPEWDRRLNEVKQETGFTDAEILYGVLTYVLEKGELEEALKYAIESEYASRVDFVIATAELPEED